MNPCPKCKSALIGGMRTHAPTCNALAHTVCYTNRLEQTVKINARSLLDARIIATVCVSEAMDAQGMRGTNRAYEYARQASFLKRGVDLTMVFADELIGSVWID